MVKFKGSRHVERGLETVINPNRKTKDGTTTHFVTTQLLSSTLDYFV